MGNVNGAEALRALSGLQEKDLEIDRLLEEASTLPQELKALQEQVEALEEKLLELRARRLELERDYHRHSLDIQDLSEKEERAKAESAKAQTPREQAQYENRIQQIKDRIRELLDLSTPLMEEMEALEAEIAQVEEEMAGLRPRLEELEAANQARVEGLKAQIAVKQGEREALAQGIPAPLLKEYEAIRRARKGLGLVRMRSQGQAFRCEGCNVVLPTHVAQKVIRGEVVHCPSCGRLLWKGEA